MDNIRYPRISLFHLMHQPDAAIRQHGAFHDETAFFDAWKTGVSLTGPRYFGDGSNSPAAARRKWDLEPQVEDIAASLGVLSSGESIFLAALVSL